MVVHSANHQKDTQSGLSMKAVKTIKKRTVKHCDSVSSKNNETGNKTSLKTFSQVFGREKFVEKFNRAKALYLDQFLSIAASGSDALNDNKEWATERDSKCIKQILQASEGRDYYSVGYKRSSRQEDTGTGRWFAKDNVCNGMQGFSRKLRGTLCEGLYTDIDFVNCHPVILQQLCEQNQIPCKNLKRYNTSRELMLQEMINAGVPDRDTAKNHVLSVLNGGDREVPLPWWDNLREEFKGIAKNISQLHPGEMDRCRSVKEENLEARAMNGILCDWECKCLEVLYKYLEQEGCIQGGKCALIFDGLQICSNEVNQKKTSDPAFLERMSKHIFTKTNLKLDVKVKPFEKGYTLPENYAELVTDCFVIKPGDDRSAADEFLRKHSRRLISSKGEWYWFDDGIYQACGQDVKGHIKTTLSTMDIQMRTKTGGLSLYSRTSRHIRDCQELILADPQTHQPNFQEKLFFSNLGFMSFSDGIYCFNDVKLYPYHVQPPPQASKTKTALGMQEHETVGIPDSEGQPLTMQEHETVGIQHETLTHTDIQMHLDSTASETQFDFYYRGAMHPVELEAESRQGVMFTCRIDRPFPKSLAEKSVEDLHQRVLQPIFPDMAQLIYFLHCTARALAGNIEDKKWYIVTGERNSGKGVLSLLWELCFSVFVQTFNSENLLYSKGQGGDPAKQQSWMSPLEYKRLAYSNELRFEEHQKIDGNMVKRFASGGDKVQCRQNYQDETEKRLQCTAFLFCNDVPPVQPEDALDTMERFDLKTRFVGSEDMEIDQMPHLRTGDPDIKRWIQETPDIQDAFVRVTLNSYSSKRQDTPQCVAKDTKDFKGEGAVNIYERIKEVVKFKNDPAMQVHTGKIQIELEKAGIKGLSPQKVNDYMRKIFGHYPQPPEYKKICVEGKRSMGFTRLFLEPVISFDYTSERRKERDHERETNRKNIWSS